MDGNRVSLSGDGVDEKEPESEISDEGVTAGQGCLSPQTWLGSEPPPWASSLGALRAPDGWSSQPRHTLRCPHFVLLCSRLSLLLHAQGLMILLQNLPTMHWGNEEVSVLLAEAYRLKFAFADAPNHYKR
ncbi:hypothetical protein NHX12_020409 [Muraenolepis orangiensis]|uniref:Uncharacterized protein n=1 Tax=Muraenolepis orangiensis TaxID=630683 RepID=A0A9Q0ISZ4_9TELE|nr:hypothetical protein NHX12_020409 [Muraenolepis orangiensis]